MNTLRIILLFGLVLLSSCSPKIPETSQVNKENGKIQPVAGRFWKDADTLLKNPACPAKVLPLSYRLLVTDTNQVKAKLLAEGDFPGVVNKDTVSIDLPMPDGTWETYLISQIQVMAPVLAAKYPYIKTYSGKSAVYPADQVRLEIHGSQIRIMVFSTRGTILVEPFCPDNHMMMMSFYKKNMPEGSKENFERK